MPDLVPEDLNALLQEAGEIDAAQAEAEAQAIKDRQRRERAAELQATNPQPQKTTERQSSDTPPPPHRPTTDDHHDDDGKEPKLRNELAEAKRFADDIDGTAWYCPQLGSKKNGEIESGWLVWDGMRLKASEDGAIYRLARATALSLSADYEAWAQDLVAQADTLRSEAKAEELPMAERVDKNEKAKALRSHARKLMGHAERVQTEDRIYKMIKHARNEDRLLVDQTELDANADLVNVINGVLDLRTGEICEHHPRFRMTRLAPVPYDPDADRTVLMRLLERAMMTEVEPGTWEPDPDRIRYLQDVIGHAIFGHQRLQKVYVCQGAGGDGKGTLFEAILDALGGGTHGYAMKASMQSFVQAKVSSHRIRDDVANMRFARMIFAAEINKGEHIDEAFLKAISGEDTQRVRHLFGKEFEFRPICTPFLQVNGAPRLDPTDKAIWRRVEIIPFGPCLTEEEKDPSVRRDMHDPDIGGKALLSWIVEGAIRTHDVRRIQRPASVDDATAAFRAEQDLVAQFAADMLRLPPPDKASETYLAAEGLKGLWQEWIDESGTSSTIAYNGKRMGATLRDLGCWPAQSRITGKNRKTWFGVTMCHPHGRWDDYAEGSFKPSEEAHLERLRAAAAAGAVSLFPQALSHAPAREKQIPPARARADGISFSHASHFNTERGNKETGKETTDATTDDSMPDW